MDNPTKNLDNIEKFAEAIPKNLAQNLEFRVRLHDWLSKDEIAQNEFLALCYLKPEIFYDAVAWTYDPRRPIGERNNPFILRPKQREALLKIHNCVKIGKDGAINKSRDEGGSELPIKYFVMYCVTVPDSNFLIGSRNQDLVDCTGDPTTLFAKIDYTVNHFPNWLKSKLHIERSLLHFRILDTNSAIDGETTNESFSAGKRATSVLLDEFGRVQVDLAKSIRDTVNRVSDCILYESTHWFGTKHPFNLVLQRKDIVKIDLLWYDNPEKNKGLYKSPEVGKIELVDKDYYFSQWPDIFNKLGVEFDIISYEKLYTTGLPEFIADGCNNIPGDLRSPWHDGEEKRGTYRDICMNVWASPIGATNQYFDPVVNTRIRSEFVRKPTYVGNIEYELKPVYNSTKTKVIAYKPSRGKFKQSFKTELSWYGELFKDEKGNLRPNQLHNYVIGCDIGFGTGSSNSTAIIGDVNTSEIVGEYVTSRQTVEEFADLVTALVKWVGGSTDEAYVIWERTGGHGINFGRRIIQNGLSLVYTKKTEATKRRKRRQVYGWDNTTASKDDLLMELKIGLKEGLKTKPQRKFLRVYSTDIVDELDSYIITDDNKIIAAEEIDQKSGARLRHGDRVIGTGLVFLGFKDQPKAVKIADNKLDENSLAYRMMLRRKRDAEKKDEWAEPKGKTSRGW